MLITLRNIDKYYNYKAENEVHALRNVSLNIQSGDMSAIVGTSGSGKSTLLKVLCAIETIEGGEYFFKEESVNKMKESQLSYLRNKEIGFVVQDFALLEDRNVLSNVMVPLLFDKNYTLKQAKEKAMETLKALSMDSFAKKRVSHLSGGQKQRIAICRAIVNDPSIILADEPTGALDKNTANDVLNLLENLNEKGMTIVIVTHDENVAQRCKNIYRVEDGLLFVDEKSS